VLIYAAETTKQILHYIVYLPILRKSIHNETKSTNSKCSNIIQQWLRKNV